MTVIHKHKADYLVCKRCIMDSKAAANIYLNKDGICNHCMRYDELIATRVLNGITGQRCIKKLANAIRVSGLGKAYDCLIGVSGGVDSTYVAYLCKQFGLRALAIHVDNGWDSEISRLNIANAMKILRIPLVKIVLDWKEFRDLQVAFLKASTPDGEIPTDQAINAVLWREAARRRIKYIITGMNFATESINVPEWSYGHNDWRYLKDVYCKHGTSKMKSFPHFNIFYIAWLTFVRGIRSVSILNYVEYKKEKIIDLLEKELDWKYYGSKHHESIYTRFYQGYILPKKFGIDKRYGHFSDLINSGQMSREHALEEIKMPPYPETEQLRDLELFLNKLDLSQHEFQEIMQAPIKSFRDYRNAYRMVQGIRLLVDKMRHIGMYPR